MENEDEGEIESFMHSFTGGAYPPVEDVENRVRVFRRRWIVRVRKSLAPSAIVTATMRAVEGTVRGEIVKHFGDVAGDAFGVGANRIGDLHLVVDVVSPNPELGVGDAAAVGTWQVLRSVDREWDIEDLQGIPRRFWFQLK
jgi:hypothetical protein